MVGDLRRARQFLDHGGATGRARAAGRGAAGGTSAFVREHPHLHSEYLAAFAAADLEVRGCVEPRFDESAAVMQGPAHHFVPDATVAVFRGLPGALVWDLTRR